MNYATKPIGIACRLLNGEEVDIAREFFVTAGTHRFESVETVIAIKRITKLYI
ncbi:hypothetical protein VCR19J5_280074 [Vibrio crassostreae]|nr:hypothetical protein VCR19J5_280074 [Vibrio crassostreae]